MAAGQIAQAGQPIGERFGDYKILRLLGEGGMGQVYLAARADDLYQQQVAIKLVQAGTARHRDLFLRFTAERQILANLVHPNIARLLDAGIASSGAPYLVMEYIAGSPIDRYVTAKQLSIRDRLALFQTVCGAVEYAHRNLVVHRDIKPANILVTEQGAPKLLDFGIAKLLQASEQSSADLTRATERLLTPEYASPEQVRGETVTTATDVYALGVLLYVLLTGNPPFKMADKSPFEVARIVCDETPTRPSSRVPLKREADKLRGELDNIVLKALRKEPERRYISVEALSEDIRRYLEGYPVQAASDSWGYRARKFVGRHKAAVTVSGLMLFTVLAFTVGTAVLAQRARRERLKAERERAFLARLLAAATPEQSRGRSVTVREILDQGAKRIDSELASEPEVQAAMLDSIGNAYLALGVYDQANPILTHAYELRRRTLGDDHLDVAATETALGTVLENSGRCPEAEEFYRRALNVRKKRLGAYDPLVGENMALLGECLYIESRDTEAEQYLRAAMPLVAPDSDTGRDIHNYLALVLERKGGFEEAVRLLREVTDSTLRIDGADSPNYATCLHNLAGALSDIGNLTEAQKTERQVLDIRRKVSGKDHPDVGYSLNNLGWFLIESGDWTGAEPFLREGLELNRKALGEKHPRVAGSINNWARVFHEKGDYRAAGKLYAEALALLQESNGAETWSAAKVEANLGLLHLDEGDSTGALHYAQQALELRRKLGGNDTPDVASSLMDIGLIQSERGDLPAAEFSLRQALDLRKKMLSPVHPSLVAAEVRMGEVLLSENKVAEAGPLLRAALSSAQASPFPLLPWQVAETQNALGAYLIADGKRAEGVKLLRASLPGLKGYPQATVRRRGLQRTRKFLDSSS